MKERRVDLRAPLITHSRIPQIKKRRGKARGILSAAVLAQGMLLCGRRDTASIGQHHFNTQFS
jgi:hypothetical protein